MTTETTEPKKRGRPRKNPTIEGAIEKTRTAITLHPSIQEELDAVRKRAQAMLQWATSCPLTTLEEVTAAENRLEIVARAAKQIATRKDELCGDLEAELALKRAAFLPIEECLTNCMKAMKARLHERIQESRAARDAALEIGDHSLAHEPVLESRVLDERVEWGFEIVNADLIGQTWWGIDVSAMPAVLFEKLRKLAPECLVLDHKAILTDVRKNKSNQTVGAGIQATCKKVAVMKRGVGG